MKTFRIKQFSQVKAERLVIEKADDGKYPEKIKFLDQDFDVLKVKNSAPYIIYRNDKLIYKCVYNLDWLVFYPDESLETMADEEFKFRFEEV